MSKRKFQVYEYIGDKLFWRTTCTHSNGSKDTFYNEDEARKKCAELKANGTRFIVDEVIRVTGEFK